jgi:hypothetical protein
MRGPLLFVLFLLLCVSALWGGVYVLVRVPARENLPPGPTQYEHFERTADGKPMCPKCGRSDRMLRYQYGLTREALPEGTTNGGCAVAPNSPEYKCGHCDARFGITSFGKGR